jgi:hypothetical protein
MTAAQRQARRREKLAREEKERRYRQGHRTAWQPPHGYQAAKQQMIAEGHVFERAREDFGFEAGVFFDDAWLETSTVIELAKLPLVERRTRIAEARSASKDEACYAVKRYMERLHVSVTELVSYLTPNSK